MLGFEAATTVTEGLEEIERLDATMLRDMAARHSCGLRLLAAPANAEDAARIHEEDLARLIRIARKGFDYVIVDTFPMLDAAVVSILDSSDLTFVVFQDFVAQVLGASNLLKTLEKIGFGRDQCRPRGESWARQLRGGSQEE